MQALILVCGLMGTGKTTFARRLSRETGFSVLRSDVLRNKLSLMDDATHQYTDYGAGIYSDEFTKRTYRKLSHEAVEVLKNGDSVIVDAAFSKQWQRHLFMEAGSDFGARLVMVECVCPDQVVRERLLAREADGKDASDGRWAIYPDQKKAYEPFSHADDAIHLIVETHREQSAFEVIEKIFALI